MPKLNSIKDVRLSWFEIENTTHQTFWFDLFIHYFKLYLSGFMLHRC